MPEYRSRTTTHGRNMAGARALWRATGMKDGDFDKPIIAISNSFTQFVSGHVHLKELGQLVAREIEAAGGVAKEFNTIAVDAKGEDAWKPVGRERSVSQAFWSYTALTTSASRGAVRDIKQLKR